MTKDEQNKNYALILNGGHSLKKNRSDYWNNCSFIYQTLIHKYGYKKENIIVLMADGRDTYKQFYS